MSSRLLTMKFMQRAAASSPTTSASPDEPSPKRRKTDSNISTPSKINVDSLADRTAVQAALASEEAKRQAALEKQAADAGDTRWVLSFEDQRLLAASSPLGLRIVQTGFANIDSSQSEIRIEEDGLEDKPVMVGRRSFGRFNKALEVSLYSFSEIELFTNIHRNNRTLPSRKPQNPDPKTMMKIMTPRKAQAARPMTPQVI